MSRNDEGCIDAYIAGVDSEEARTVLYRLAAIMREEAPDAEEVIRYGMPAFKIGKREISIGAFKNHCSLFAGHIVSDFAVELQGYTTSKGTIQFPLVGALPEDLIRTIVRARIASFLADPR